MGGVLTIRGEKGGMECVVDFPCFWKAEFIGDWRENFDNCERSFLFWCEL